MPPRDGGDAGSNPVDPPDFAGGPVPCGGSYPLPARCDPGACDCFPQELLGKSECMRPDMAQVIIERPRGGQRYKTPKGSRRRLQRGLDDGPRREGIKRVWGAGTKWLSEHLAPLRRFLLGQVGRPWDHVFAEICQHLRVDS